MHEPALLPWHADAWGQLVGMSNLPHAFLLVGPAGIGKRAFAARLAAWLLCLQPRDGQACGSCRSCLLREAGSHPDLFQVGPEEEGKQIRIERIRNLIDFINQTAQQGGRKVVLLDPADAMNQNASNALLKTLEEPAQDTFLLLVSDQPGLLLPTVRSRCRHLPLSGPDATSALDWLRESLSGLPDDQLALLLALAGGAPLRALQLHEQAVLEHLERVVTGIKQLLKDQVSVSVLADRLKSVPLLLLVDWLHDWTLTLQKLKLGLPAECAVADMQSVLGYMARHAAAAELQAWQDWLLQHRRMLLTKANLNQTLLLESLWLHWKRLGKRR